MDMNFEKMTDDELRDIAESASNILRVRKQREKEKAWREIIKAISDFVSKYEPIEVTDGAESIAIGTSATYDIIGSIVDG